VAGHEYTLAFANQASRTVAASEQTRIITAALPELQAYRTTMIF
jgi:hypothetical protein